MMHIQPLLFTFSNTLTLDPFQSGFLPSQGMEMVLVPPHGLSMKITGLRRASAIVFIRSYSIVCHSWLQRLCWHWNLRDSLSVAYLIPLWMGTKDSTGRGDVCEVPTDVWSVSRSILSPVVINIYKCLLSWMAQGFRLGCHQCDTQLYLLIGSWIDAISANLTKGLEAMMGCLKQSRTRLNSK